MPSSNPDNVERLAIPSWPGVMPEVEESVLRALRDGSWGRYDGPYCASLAQSLAERFSQPYVTPCSSGTIAVELALRGLGVEPGQEVILGGYDFPGNFRAIEAIGAIPVLIDIAGCVYARHRAGGKRPQLKYRGCHRFPSPWNSRTDAKVGGVL
jgi:hypothetical protein